MANIKKLRIIIIDDDIAINLLLKIGLTKLGHNVLTFPDPTVSPCLVLKEATCFCPQELPCADIVISDIVMPNMSGIDFFKLQRARGCKAPNENKALISATINKVSFESIDELGCNFFKKPFRLVDIFKWIEKCAERIPESRALSRLG